MKQKIKRIEKKLKVGRSSAGLGLFALEPIDKGEFVIEYFGEIIPTAEADRRGGRYLFDLSSRRTIDGSTRKNTARYINHSCRPNCETEIKSGKVFIFARKNIKPGEELSYDYGREYFNEYIKPHGCRCSKCLEKKA